MNGTMRLALSLALVAFCGFTVFSGLLAILEADIRVWYTGMGIGAAGAMALIFIGLLANTPSTKKEQKMR